MAGDQPWLLAIDTSTEWAGLALTNGLDVVERNWESGRNQTAQLLPEIERMLAQVGITVADLGAIGVAIGPGSFSGLRVGLSVAKGFALALDVPLIGVSTLEMTVHGWELPDRAVVGVVKAGRRRLVWGGGDAQRDLASGEIDDLIAALPRDVLIVGEIDDEAAARLAEAGYELPPEPKRRRRALALAAIARDHWLRGEVDAAAALEPLYVHPS